MKTNKIIITINNIEDIEKLKKLGITKYAFPLEGFCVGIPNTFLISEIKENAYIYINRVLDNDGISKLKEVLNNLPSNIIGIIFDDLGIINALNDIKIEKILYLSHFNTNSISTKLYLEYVDSVILSTDITKEEIKQINKSIKDISLYTFGYVMAMYSRRHLLDNYSKFHNIKCNNPLLIDNTNHKFLVYENEYGTVFYHSKIFNGLELFEVDAKYYFFNMAFLDIDTLEKALNNELDESLYDKGFLYQETIYKLRGDIND